MPRWCKTINALRLPVLALDVPSGINADTGAVMGHAVRAARTITFIGLKPGLLTLDGPDHCGELHADALGLDTESLLPAQGRLLDETVLPRALARRPAQFPQGAGRHGGDPRRRERHGGRSHPRRTRGAQVRRRPRAPGAARPSNRPPSITDSRN